MRSTCSAAFSLILVAAAVASSSAFAPSRIATAAPPTALRASQDDKKWAVDETAKESEAPIGLDKFNIPNPFAELGDMLSNFDDVIDDFFYKRMAGGEVFYGKRKYKPSGKISSDYNGGGLTDLQKIEEAREYRALRRMMKEESKAKEE
ncbi:hypothetical protein ACHAXR_010647 [Thalassiosira sp. AJA248-18]